MLPFPRLWMAAAPRVSAASGRSGTHRCDTMAETGAEPIETGSSGLAGRRPGVSRSTSDRTAESSALPGAGSDHFNGPGPVCTSGGRSPRRIFDAGDSVSVVCSTAKGLQPSGQGRTYSPPGPTCTNGGWFILRPPFLASDESHAALPGLWPRIEAPLRPAAGPATRASGGSPSGPGCVSHVSGGWPVWQLVCQLPRRRPVLRGRPGGRPAPTGLWIRPTQRW
jgi:hypothetical protein